MRRPVVVAMSAVSLTVVTLGLRASDARPPLALPSAPPGIVGAGPQPSVGAASRPDLPAPAAPAAAAPAPTAASPSTATAAPGSAAAPAAGASPSRTATIPRTATPASPAAGHPAPPAASSKPRTVTVNGTPASTQYGPVQVQITMTNGRITAANAISYPRYDRREQQINDPAVAQLNDETLQAQSAAIDTVSGATYTSGGYQQSLQSAIDAAHAG